MVTAAPLSDSAVAAVAAVAALAGVAVLLQCGNAAASSGKVL